MARFIKKCPECDYSNKAAAIECNMCKYDIKTEFPTPLIEAEGGRAAALLESKDASNSLVLREAIKKILLTVPPSGGIIGRAGTICADALENYDTVSRQHLKIVFRGGNWVVEDLGSVNGTRINGRKINPHVTEKICVNDVLAIANLNFTVSVGGGFF